MIKIRCLIIYLFVLMALIAFNQEGFAQQTEIKILKPNNENIVLSEVNYVSVQAEVEPCDKLLRIDWEVTISGSITFTTSTSNFEIGMLLIGYPDSNSGFGRVECIAKAKIEDQIEFIYYTDENDPLNWFMKESK